MKCHERFCLDVAVYRCPECKHELCEWHYKFHKGYCPMCAPPKMKKIESDKE